LLKIITYLPKKEKIRMEPIHLKEKTPLFIQPLQLQLTQPLTPGSQKTKLAPNNDWLLWLDKILDVQRLHHFSQKHSTPTLHLPFDHSSKPEMIKPPEL
jgi:hypothetical protein